MPRAPHVVAIAAVAAAVIGAGSAAARRASSDAIAVAELASLTGPAPLAARVAWRAAAAGIEVGELRLSGTGEAWRMRVIVARLDPRQVAVAVVPAFAGERRWSIADADAAAVLALDAGQFRGSSPWGWVVSGGRELLSPQYAPLAGTLVVGDSGTVRILGPEELGAVRDSGAVREAFQSYPILLLDGTVPAPLLRAGLGVNVAHRDARLAIGTTAEGRVVVALSRFDALGQSLGRIPFGFTSEEMATVMKALGCRRALLLDGGISGQLMVRGADGSPLAWPGVRKVPLGLVAHPKD